jgi:hypothetical protein
MYFVAEDSKSRITQHYCKDYTVDVNITQWPKNISVKHLTVLQILIICVFK